MYIFEYLDNSWSIDIPKICWIFGFWYQISASYIQSHQQKACFKLAALQQRKHSNISERITSISPEFDKLVLSNCFPVLCHKFLNGKIFIVSKRNKFYYIYIPANKKKKHRRAKEQKNLIDFCKKLSCNRSLFSMVSLFSGLTIYLKRFLKDSVWVVCQQRYLLQYLLSSIPPSLSYCFYTWKERSST